MIKLKNLQGLSGCHIELLALETGEYCVRKTSGSPAYNDRLQKQIAKQILFQSPIVKTPSILAQGFDENGLYYCMMEYVHGLSFAEFLNLYPFSECLVIFEKLLTHIFSNREAQNVDADLEVLVRNKIDDLKSKIDSYDDLLSRMRNSVPLGLRYAETHGDLTFENVLIDKRGEIYFIDFLDSFVDSRIIDLSKLNQELSLKWSVRKRKPDADLSNKYHKLNSVFVDRCAQHDVDRKALNYFSILTLLRILPYTNDNRERSIIHKKIETWQKELL